MKTLKFTSIFLLSLLAFFGCRKEDVFPGDIEVSTNGTVLKIYNRLESKVYYLVMEIKTASLSNWAPTIDESSPCIESKKTAEIDFENIYGYKNDAEEAVVYYWVAVDENRSLVPGEIHSIVVPL